MGAINFSYIRLMARQPDVILITVGCGDDFTLTNGMFDSQLMTGI